MDTRKPPRILIVEDEWILAEELAANLSDLGYSVAGPVSSTAEALALLKGETFDAAVLDVSLGSGEKSFPIAAALAAQGIPFLFTTGYQAADLPAQFCRGIVIAKPVLLSALKRSLGEILPAR